MPYIGSRAGSNVAAPTIKTTNYMPIVQPPSFDALGLVSFQINPHYLDPDPNSKHMGETREERILQFLEENDTPLVGLREGAILRIAGGGWVVSQGWEPGPSGGGPAPPARAFFRPGGARRGVRGFFIHPPCRKAR